MTSEDYTNFSLPLGSPRPVRAPPSPPARSPPPPPLSEPGQDIGDLDGVDDDNDQESTSADIGNYISSAPTNLVRRPRVVPGEVPDRFRSLRRSASSPLLSISSSAPAITEAAELAASRDGAISRIDRYSRLMTSPPPSPPPIAGPSRPSGLRNITFAPTMEGIGEREETEPMESSSPSEPSFEARVNFGILHRARALVKKISLPSFRTAESSAFTRTLEISAPVATKKATPEEIAEMLRKMTAQSGDLSPVADSSQLTAEDSASQQAEIVGEEESEVKKGKRRARSESMESASTTTSTTMPTGTVAAIDAAPSTSAAQLSENQRGKLPARADSAASSTGASSAPTLVSEQSERPIGWKKQSTFEELRAACPPFKKEDRIPDNEIDAHVAQLFSDFAAIEHIVALRNAQVKQDREEFLALRLREERQAPVVPEAETSAAAAARDEVEINDDIDNDSDDDESFVWDQYGEPHPDYVDGGWAQEDSATGWFMFDTIESVLGGPRCPLTNAGFDGFPEEEVTAFLEAAEERAARKLQAEKDAAAAEATQAEQAEQTEEAVQTSQTIQLVAEEANEQLADEDEDQLAIADESYDDDARQITQAEILCREGLL